MTSTWSLIPPDILVSIFKLLNDEDLYRSSRVCRFWNNVSKTPCLWRNRTFVFRGYCRSYATRVKNISKCIRSVGCHVRVLTLSCPTPNLLTAHNVTNCVQTLFRELLTLQLQPGGSNLDTFVLKDLDFEETWGVFRTSKRELISNLKMFLSSQQKLKSIDLSNAFLPPPFVSKVIEAIIRNRSMRNLEKVDLENFFGLDVPSARQSHVMRGLFSSLSALRKLSINQSYLTDKTFVHLCSRLRNTLQQIDLLVTCRGGGTVELYNVSSNGWREALQFCPDMKVTMTFDFWPSDIVDRLLPELPLTVLTIQGYICGLCRSSYASRINRLLTHLSRNYRTTLGEISLFLTFGNLSSSPSLSNEDLVSFWASCPKLQTANFSQDLVFRLNGSRHQGRGWGTFRLKRTLKIDASRCVRVKRISSQKREEYFRFYLSKPKC